MTKLYQKLLKPEFSSEEMKMGLESAKKIPGDKERIAILSSIFSMIDLTSLNVTDNSRQIKTFTEKAAAFNLSYPYISNVAAVCVFPNFVVPALEGLGKSGVKLAVVSASFPTSQTFLEVKMLETEIAVRNGADEIDIVIPLGMFLERDYDAVIEEIKSLRQVAGEAVLKVIIESGLLADKEQIYRASIIAMESGADFIKTSTGKSPVSATPEAAWIMCRAIHDYYEETGIMIGFKPAGGIVTTDDAISYYNIVRDVLGETWLSKEYFRIGASRLANNILKEIFPELPAYF